MSISPDTGLQNIVLISARLMLRSFTEHDAEESFACATPMLTRFMSWDPSSSLAAFAEIWREWLPKMAAGTDLMLAVREKSTGEFFGMVGLHGIGGAEPEIGIWIKEAAHGAGYGREAVAATIAWACRSIGATAFTYPVAVENLPSRRLAESIGGKISGTRNLRKPSGVVLDEFVYRIVPSAPHAKTSSAGWEALGQWGEDAVRIEPLAGGVANDVWSVRVHGHLAVGRLGARSDADLAWETGLIQHLDREGLTVPVPIPTTDGRLFADGLVVMTYMEGGPPETEADWRRVADTLRRLHRLTQGWPQRPGWRSSTDLLHAETGTKIDLGAMPPDGVVRCRAAWARLLGRETCVVHGNPNSPNNVRMTAERVALINWDEAHVDVPDLDLVLPHNAAGLDHGAYDIAAQASAAWEAAVCWDDAYAIRRLAEVRAV